MRPTGPSLALSEAVYTRESRNRLDESRDRSIEGARAALETFYCAFNRADLTLLRDVWLDDRLVQLNNPLGGMLRGLEPIAELYGRVFDGPGTAWVGFEDVLELTAGEAVVFAGRERGEYARPGFETVELEIRTSRFFCYLDGVGWRQAHHHGSIDESALLQRYQEAVRAPEL
jgi:hypothetical protein